MSGTAKPEIAAPNALLALVERFEEQSDAYKSGGYNEAQLRQEFIDPMFEALGWDMQNRSGYAEAYKDVIHEDAIKIGGVTKAPDYCFRIGGTRKFFLEAKKPSVDIKSDASPAYQLRRYAWSAKLPLSVLTDFEEFAVYDCRIEPKLGDKASVARVLYLDYKGYESRWNDIAKVFARDAILKGSFDKFAESNKTKRGTAEVDDAFLYEIEQWRADLARNLAMRNPELTQRDLNFSVQRTIDRIVFLRICEDRRIEVYGRLQALLNGEHLYRRLYQLFREADTRYNSGLFHFDKEKGRIEPPDDLTPGLNIDDAVLKRIIRRLYYPESPYEFSVLPADILGQVYEQFLGKVIRLTEGHQAKVEDKPEVKKAGGVYYTPTYIVEYIVRNTVGKLLNKKTPKQADKLRILDPGCGSGSFLIGAYQYLLDWYRDWYLAHDPERFVKGKHAAIYEGQGGEWKLTTAERKRILLQNIYGVDIDAQAVETTKLSLLLKVLEGESQQTLGTQLRFYHERALPDLGRNIKCGNSLIATDFYHQTELHFADDEEQLRINAFDWDGDDGFPEILTTGGFDVVIGNPPYRMLQPHNTDEAVLAYLRANYVAAEFKMELFHMFLQRGVSLLKDQGLQGYIVPTTLLNNVYAETLREWITARCCVESISVARGRVFANADVHTSVITLRRESRSTTRARHQVVTTSQLSEAFAKAPSEFSRIQQSRFARLPGHVWNVLVNESNAALITRLSGEFPPLETVATINRGLITGARSNFFSATKKSKAYVPIVAGSDVHRYWMDSPREYVLFERPDTAGGCWDEEVHFSSHKIVVRQIGLRPTASILLQPIAVTGNVFTIRAESVEKELYLLGIINSRLTNFFWSVMFTDFKSSFPQVTIFSLGQLPIRHINPANAGEKRRRDGMVSLVECVLALHKQLAAAKTEHDKNTVRRQIDASDAQIDRLVYELYELSPDEIEIVESATT